MKDGQVEGRLVTARAKLDKAYDRINVNGSNDEDSVGSTGSSPVYAEQTEDGYIGLEAPLG